VPEVYWPVAERKVRIVKTVRTQRKNRTLVVHNSTGKRRTGKEVFREQGTHFYPSNLELGSLPPTFIHPSGRSRWSIDTEVFQTIPTDCHLQKPSAHQGRGQAQVILTTIRVLAFTLSMVFYSRFLRRQSCSAPAVQQPPKGRPGAGPSHRS